MPGRLAQDIIDNVLLKQNVDSKFELEIRDYDDAVVSSSLYLEHFKGHNIRTHRDFPVGTASLNFNNPGSIFSPENESAVIKVGYTIQITQYFSDYPAVAFPRFYGFIRQINPTRQASGSTVTMNCYDALIKAQDADLDAEFESSEKYYIEDEQLTGVALVDFPEKAQIFNASFGGWADNPPAEINMYRVDNNFVSRSSIQGFEVNQVAGQVVLNAPVSTDNNLLTASYWYYREGFYIEDLIRNILQADDDFGDPLFTDINLKTTLFTEESVSVDNLTPVQTPINFKSVTATTLALSDTNFVIPEKDAWKFLENQSGRIGEIEVSWTTRTAILIGGVTYYQYTLTAAIGERVFQGTSVSVFYEPDNNGHTQVWRASYNNIITAITSGDFTIPGSTFAGFDSRTGLLLTASNIDQSSSVTLNIDYQFYTLQATGIEVPYLKIDKQTNKNRIEVIKNQLLSLVPPNYVLFTRGDKKIWASFLSQKNDDFEDYDLTLNTRVNYISDQESYTRVHLFGRSNDPHNLMLDESTTIPDNTTINAYGEANDQELFVNEDLFEAGLEEYFKFTYTKDGKHWADPAIRIIPFWKIGSQIKQPSVKINGVPIGRELQRITKQKVIVEPVKKRKDAGLTFGIITIMKTVAYDVRIPDAYLAPPVENNAETWIIFRNSADEVVTSGSFEYIFKAHDDENMSNGVIKLIDQNGDSAGNLLPDGNSMLWKEPPFPMDVLETIDRASYAIIRTELIDGRESVIMRGDGFYIHKNLINYEIIPDSQGVPNGVTSYVQQKNKKLVILDRIEASFRYSKIVTAFDSMQNLRDGDPETVAEQMYLNDPPVKGSPIAYIDFAEEKSIQAIDVIGGHGHPDIDVNNVVDSEFQLTIEKSNTAGFARLRKGYTSGAYLYVEWQSLANFPSSGVAYIGDESFTYTSIESGYYDFGWFNRGFFDRFEGVSGLTQNYYYGDADSDGNVGQWLVTSEPWTVISRETAGFTVSTGNAVSFEEQQLGRDLSIRALRLVLEKVKKLNYQPNKFIWPVSIASLNVYSDVVYDANARLSLTTFSTASVVAGNTSVSVESTAGFPSSGTIWVGSEQVSYSSKNSTQFLGVLFAKPHPSGSFITENDIWSNDSLYVPDYSGLIQKYGDKVYKDKRLHQNLTSQRLLNVRAKNLLAEYMKNHSKVRIDNLYAPYVYVGQTVRLQDSGGFERNYFVEGVTSSDTKYTIDLAYYP